MRKLYSSVLLLLGISLSGYAQTDTWDDIYTVLSTSCAGGSCHQTGSPIGNAQGWFVDESPEALYDSLIGRVPINPAAAGKNNTLIEPGYPERSFLLRKIANCLSGDLALEPAEGQAMPTIGQPVDVSDVETIRQWILVGAPETGDVVDKGIIVDYYNGGGAAKMEPLTPPDTCEGFQIHLGPIFLAPGEEKEFFKKHQLIIPDGVEVTGLEVSMNVESHHFILRKFKPGTEQNWTDFLEPLNPLTAFDNDKDYVMAWQDDQTFFLPNGTAYRWAPGTALDLNYHILNPSPDKILATEFYLNVYTQPMGTALKEMKSTLINNAALFIPPNSNPTFEEDVTLGNKSIWTLTSHAHERGVDYDIWLRNPDGSKGDQIYEGFYDFNYEFYQGFYDWEHPPTRYWEPFMHLPAEGANGLIHRAEYLNNENRLITFGFTTRDEMMIIYAQYVDDTFNIPAQPVYTPNCNVVAFKDPCDTTTSVGLVNLASNSFEVGPNPFRGTAQIRYGLDNNASVSLEVFDLQGRLVTTIIDEVTQAPGFYNYPFTTKNINVLSGMYMVRLTVDGESITEKLLELR